MMKQHRWPIKSSEVSFLLCLVLVFSSLSILAGLNRRDSVIESELGGISQSTTVIGPIRIVSDRDWSDLVFIGKVTGNGTQENPYLISNLKINGMGSPCILISSVRGMHYKIVNCTLYNGDYGIRIVYADMGDIIGNNISYNRIGISTMPYLPLHAQDTVISGNIISYNTEHGIDSGEFYDADISNNKITFNGRHGIYAAWHNEKVNITNNNISFNGDYGLILVSFDQSIIQNNDIFNNRVGVFLWTSYNNIVRQNNVNFNDDYGIYFFGDANSNTISNNTIIVNRGFDLYFRDSNNNTVFENMIIVRGSQPFYWFVGECIGNTFVNNTVYYDLYERNDIFEQATTLVQGYYPELVAINEDWYRVFLKKGEVGEIFLNYSVIYEPLGLEFYNESKDLLKYSNAGVIGPNISYNATSDGYYYFRVWNGWNLNYSLQIDVHKPPDISPPPDSPLPVPPNKPSPSFSLEPMIYTILISTIIIVGLFLGMMSFYIYKSERK